MVIIKVPLNPGARGADVKELHDQLSALGARIDPAEQTGEIYGPTTVEAVRSFQEQFGLPVADGLDLPAVRLLAVAAAFACDDGRAALRAAVREVAAALNNGKPQSPSGANGRANSRAAVREAAAATDGAQPQALYWLAHYATIAGDYETAQSIARRIPDHTEIKNVINPIIATLDQQALRIAGQQTTLAPSIAPEMSYPENFYAYRRDFYSLDALIDAQRQIAAVGEPPRNPNQAYPPSGTIGAMMIQSAVAWFEALKQWQIGNEHLNRQRYAAAQAAYDACQSAVCDYFSRQYSINVGNGSLLDRLANVIKYIGVNESSWAAVWSRISWRRSILTLDELRAWDWPEQPPSIYVPRLFDPAPVSGTLPPRPDYGLGFVQKYFRRGEVGEDPATTLAKQTDLESRLITLAFVLAPLARAEANRARRQFDAAIRDLRWVIDSVLIRTIPPLPENAEDAIYIYARIACEFIELPFARLLLAETMLEKADAEYKARIAAAPPPAPDVTDYQGLKAAQTYLAIKDEFEDEGEYVARVNESVEQLTQKIQERLAANDTRSPEFQILGKAILVPTVISAGDTLPGLDRGLKIHEPLLKFAPPSGQPTMREINPRVYAVLLSATARLEQLKAGFNYLGYLDTYAPPWRFQFLLERARYFAEHARNTQREFLNFLSNAEREDFQELSASQNVEMEKSNVRIETARVDQVRSEVAVAQQSKELALLLRDNANERFNQYQAFDDYADMRDWMSRGGMLLGVIGGAISGAIKGGGVWGAIGGGLSAAGAAVQQEAQLEVAGQQRELEKKNLKLAAAEAAKSAEVAAAQLAAAQASLVVAGLQRQAALLRHEFALQNLEYLRNRVLSAEQWYRLVAAIRSISETYLRYSVELAFLAEQAYEFEADKRINVIRYDYDLSEVGDFLAADFLLRDLDTLEQDLIVTQRQRQQQVRYVLSMAREFPEALQEIRDTGKASFSLRLEQLEKRFPGLYNLRIGAVDVLPVALMDSTRFSLELSHLGASQVRLKAQPDTPPGTPSSSPLNTNDLPVPEGGWLADLQEAWPVKLRVTGPETSVFSGLTRQDANAVFPFATVNQRHAFEGLGAAAAWRVDFTARENQVVPDTLADLLITFTLSGYHDPELRSAIDQAPRPTTAETRWFPGRSLLPDSFYEFNRSGRMAWNITRNLLTLTDNLGAVRNVALFLPIAAGAPAHFGRVVSRCETRVRITSTGGLEILSEIPQVTFTLGSGSNSLRLTAQATLAPGASEISWDFGDGSARQSGVEQQHLYAKPGRYTVTLRVVRNSRLSEFRADVVVSRSHADRIIPPLTAFPTLTRVTGADIPTGHTRVRLAVNSAANDPVIANWRIEGQGTEKGNVAFFDLEPGDYTLFFMAARILKTRVYCAQRHLTEPLFDFNGLSLTTNRRFDLNGNDVTGIGDNPPPNALTTHLFGNGALSPVDEWIAELPLSDNPCLRSVSATDVEQFSLAEIQDVVLALEYETTPENS